MRRELAVDAVLSGGGEMGALMRSIDWSKTAVGPVEGWPQSLRTALSIVLETGFPMYVAWGKDFTQFYNDGYRPILGSTKHPAAMGASTRHTFAEIWNIIGPMFEGVMEGTATTVVDFMLPLDRYGFVEECYFIFSYSPIREESGRVGGVLVTVTETSARVLGERRLKTSQALAAQTRGARTVAEACRVASLVLAENADDIPHASIYLADGDGRHARLMARCGPEAAAETAEVVDLTGSADAHPFAQVLESGRALLLEEPDRAVPQRVLVLPILQPGAERPLGVLVSGSSPRLRLDDTYRSFLALVASQIGTAIQGAQALEDAKARAEALAELDRAKTAFFNNVSHEFRTPLTLMLGPTEEALASPERALKGEDLETVHRNELRLLRLVNTLLDFARIEAGRASATYEPTDLAALTRDVASAFRSAVERAGLRLEVSCPPLPALVYVDREMWEKVVLNLLSNAFKFTFTGAIAVDLAWRDTEVELRVRDSGIGIAPDDLEHVFDRFHRIDRARARTHEGSGIGLALVRELVGMHGGSIEASSVVGQGTTFSVRVPTGSAHLSQDRIGTERSQGGGATLAMPFVEEALRWLPSVVTADASPPTAPGGASIRVLVADDNADMREYITRLLGSRFTVEPVADGLAALEAARRRKPDVVISDVMMPGLDGFQLLAALRASEATKSVPVILLSARAGEEAKIEGLGAGADDYLVKPFSARELVARVEAQIVRAQVRSVEEAHAIQLTTARRAAEEANRAKDDFLAMLGHELRNPLAPILTALQLMRLRGVTGADREREIIERQVKHMVALVDDLLDVSRITRGKVQLKHEPVDVADVMARAIEMSSPLIEERRHVLDVVVPRGLVVAGDAARLAQVFANLLTNAAKYTDAGGRLSVTASAEGGEAIVTVSDDGSGIAPEMLPRIFDLFSQERQDIERSRGGLGLGLAIVRSLVHAHGGAVGVRSEGRGCGSEFTVRLPLAPQAQHGETATASAAAADKPSGGRRVLVVDDNEDGAEALATMLSMLGHVTRTVGDGPSALRAAEEFDPDVVLLDIGLPLMDGYEVATRLRAAPRSRRLELVALTGYGQQADRERTRAAGFDAHMVKPVDVERLESWLRTVREP